MSCLSLLPTIDSLSCCVAAAHGVAEAAVVAKAEAMLKTLAKLTTLGLHHLTADEGGLSVETAEGAVKAAEVSTNRLLIAVCCRTGAGGKRGIASELALDVEAAASASEDCRRGQGHVLTCLLARCSASMVVMLQTLLRAH